MIIVYSANSNTNEVHAWILDTDSYAEACGIVQAHIKAQGLQHTVREYDTQGIDVLHNLVEIQIVSEMKFKEGDLVVSVKNLRDKPGGLLIKAFSKGIVERDGQQLYVYVYDNSSVIALLPETEDVWVHYQSLHKDIEYYRENPTEFIRDFYQGLIGSEMKTEFSSYEEAAKAYRSCSNCGNREFEVNESGITTLSLPPKFMFTLICTHCNEESQQFLLASSPRKRIIVRSDSSLLVFRNTEKSDE